MTQSVLVLGKGRRVEDDEVVFIPHFIEELESIGGKGLVAGISGEVERDVGIDEFHSLGTAIHGMYEVSPSAHAINTESTGITEHVEHVASLGVRLQQRAVITLIDKESRLLTLEPVDMELQSVLQGNVAGGFSQQETVLLTEGRLEGKRCLTLVEDILEGVPQHGL